MLGKVAEMKLLLNKLKQPWGFTRIVRLILGIFVCIQGFNQGSWLLVALAVILFYQSLSNFKCIPCNEEDGCGSIQTVMNKTDKKLEDTSFEEIK